MTTPPRTSAHPEAAPARERDRRLAGLRWNGRSASVLAAVTAAQAVLFYDHFAVALTVLFGIGLGLWMRSWMAGFWAAATCWVAMLLAAGTGWLHDARPFAEPLLGGALAFLGGVIGGGILQILTYDTAADDEPPASYTAAPEAAAQTTR